VRRCDNHLKADKASFVYNIGYDIKKNMKLKQNNNRSAENGHKP